jgi:DNA-binding MarR family transcriptional regulator
MPDVAPLAAELRFVLNRLNRRLRQQQLGDDLTVSQLSVLAVLGREGALTAGDLAAKEHVRPPSMTRIIAGLQAVGMIERGENPADGRQVLVGLTETGRYRTEAENAAREQWLAQQLSVLSAEERQVLREAAGILNRLAGG